MAGVWARRLRPASFRGVPFKVESHTYGTGRKTVQHEAPGGDNNFAEDLGRKTRTFNISGHLIGDDVFRLRDNLINACEQEGSGELIHPYLGTKIVQCVNFDFTEDTKQGRIVTFSIQFKEAGKANFPIGLFDNIAKFFDAVNNTVDSVNDAFNSVYDIANVPGFVVDEAVNTINNALDAVDNAITKVRSIPAKKSEMQEKIANLKGLSQELARDSETLGNELTNIIKDLKGVVSDPEETDAIDIESGADDKISVFDSLITFGNDVIVIETGTPSRVKQSANVEAINKLIRQNAIIASSEQSVIKDFATIQDADRQREKLIDLIETVLDTSDDDSLFQNFSDLKSNIIKTVPNESVVLASEITITLKQTNPSLTVIYDETGSIEQEASFIKRNNIRNPGFIKPGDYTATNG